MQTPEIQMMRTTGVAICRPFLWKIWNQHNGVLGRYRFRARWKRCLFIGQPGVGADDDGVYAAGEQHDHLREPVLVCRWAVAEQPGNLHFGSVKEPKAKTERARASVRALCFAVSYSRSSTSGGEHGTQLRRCTITFQPVPPGYIDFELAITNRSDEKREGTPWL